MILDSAKLAVFKLTLEMGHTLSPWESVTETVILSIICLNAMGEETEAQKEAENYPRWHRPCDSGELSFP